MKRELRERLLRIRDAIKPGQKRAKDSAIKERLFSLDEFKRAKCTLFYASFRSEVDTMGCLQDVIKEGKRLALPVVDRGNKKLLIFEVKDISELIPGYMGIPEPGIREGRAMDLNEIDVAIIPGIGFDPTGNRLGYGAGYYDRLLGRVSASKKHITTIGLAFEEQIVERIPAEPHDMKVDIIVTEERTIHCVS